MYFLLCSINCSCTSPNDIGLMIFDHLHEVINDIHVVLKTSRTYKMQTKIEHDGASILIHLWSLQHFLEVIAEPWFIDIIRTDLVQGLVFLRIWMPAWVHPVVSAKNEVILTS